MSDRDPDEPGSDVRDDSNGPSEPGEGATDAEEEWEFTLEDIAEREADAEAAAEAEAADEERRSEPVEAGDPSVEGTVFVVLGVVFTLFVLSRLVVG